MGEKTRWSLEEVGNVVTMLWYPYVLSRKGEGIEAHRGSSS